MNEVEENEVKKSINDTDPTDENEVHDPTHHDWPDNESSVSDSANKDQSEPGHSKANPQHSGIDLQSDSDCGSQSSHASNETLVLSDSIFNTTLDTSVVSPTSKGKYGDSDDDLEDSEVVKKYQSFASKILGKHDPPPLPEGAALPPETTPGKPYYSDPSKIQAFPTIGPTDAESKKWKYGDSDDDLEDSEVVKKYQPLAAKIFGKPNPPPLPEEAIPPPYTTLGKMYHSDCSKKHSFHTFGPTEKESFNLVSWFFVNFLWVAATYAIYRIQNGRKKLDEKEDVKDKHPKKSKSNNN